MGRPDAWRRPLKPRKSTVIHKTYEEVLAESGSTPGVDSGLGQIVDLTGRALPNLPNTLSTAHIATPTEEELETFRRQWREEVSARSRQNQPSSSAPQHTAHATSSRPQHSQRHKAPLPSDRPKDAHADEAEPHEYHDLGEKQFGRKLAEPAPESAKVPVSALDHYEEAVRRETQGNLGDSVNLYRKAFKVLCEMAA